LLPKRFALDRVETDEVSLGAECVDLPIVDRRGRPRAVAVFHVGVIARVRMYPEELAGYFVETQDALNLRRVQVVVDVNSSLRHGWAGVPVADSRPPADG